MNNIACLILNPSNTLYLTGFKSSNLKLVLLNDVIYAFTDFRYIEALAKVKGVTPILIKDGFYNHLKSFLIDHNIDTLCLEDDFITIKELDLYKDITKNIIFDSQTMLNHRKVKTDEEIKKIKKAAEIADKSFSHILSFLKEGVSELELKAELEYFMLKNESESPAFDTIVLFGENTSLPHGTPSANKLKNNDIILIDFGATFRNYRSDMTRTVFFGKNQDSLRLKVYDIVLIAQIEALKRVQQDVSCKTLDLMVRDEFTKYGYEKNFGHSLGHGVGIDIHEAPTLSSKSEEVLKEGNIITIEPGIYIEKNFGVRIEDLVLVTKDGYEILSNSSKKLTIL